jgi:hypothetical protein
VLNLVTESAPVMPKSKHSMLPILVALFVISYGLMTMLIVEQGRTIDTQRFLIKQLFSDSAQLSAMKGDMQQKQNQAKAHAHAQVAPSPAAPAEKAKKSHSNKLTQPESLKPPTAASDSADERRILETI